jgi:hypothetical protein
MAARAGGSGDGGSWRSGGRPPWKPVMTRAEAKAWARGTVLDRPLFHVTERANLPGIAARGFDLSQATGGRTWGNGVYATDSHQALAFYARYFADPVALELRVRVRRVLHVDLSNVVDDPTAHERVVAMVPDGLRRYQQRRDQIKARNLAIQLELERRHPPVRGKRLDPEEIVRREAFLRREGFAPFPAAEALVVVLRQAGYDALALIDEPFRASVGGSQVVVFDPRRVVVIGD